MKELLDGLKRLFVLKLPRFFARLFGKKNHAANSKQTKNFSPSSRSYTVLALASHILIHLKRPAACYGSYKGVIKREAVYKCTNKDYLPEA